MRRSFTEKGLLDHSTNKYLVNGSLAMAKSTKFCIYPKMFRIVVNRNVMFVNQEAELKCPVLVHHPNILLDNYSIYTITMSASCVDLSPNKRSIRS